MIRVSNPESPLPKMGVVPAPPHPQEFARLASLCGLRLGDVGPDALFDGIAQQAATMCGAPMGTVSLIREHDQTFVGKAGLVSTGSDRTEAICAHTILQSEPLIIEDTKLDSRFFGLEIVTGAPFVRFYAGAPLFDASGLPLGSVCVLDTVSRSLSMSQLLGLKRLASMAGVILETRRYMVELMSPNPHPVAVAAAMSRLDRILTPLVDRSNGFKTAI